jgi:2-succinyl-5-enolpyruvyl-6-hydroxy-3-cyclohexene-1-carboxylate synthase
MRDASAALPDDFLEGWVARTIVEEAPTGSMVFLSSSMPIRDVDAFGGPGRTEFTALGNRGASGIDGVVSTALGTGAAADRPLVCLVGDLALLHDGNGFLAAREVARPTVFVVVDNDGGGIFHRLPIARFEPEFTEYFATPHGLDLEHLARLHGVPFLRVASPSETRAAVRDGLSRPEVSIVCATVDRASGHRARLAAEEQLGRAAVTALGED